MLYRLRISQVSQSSSPLPSHVIVLRKSSASYKLSITGYQLPNLFRYRSQFFALLLYYW